VNPVFAWLSRGQSEMDNGLRTRAGADGGKLSDEKKLRRENGLKNAQSPQRRVHAVLARF
jgi:hypothetical protein